MTEEQVERARAHVAWLRSAINNPMLTHDEAADAIEFCADLAERAQEYRELLRPFVDGVVGAEDESQSETWPDDAQLQLSVRAEHVHAARAALSKTEEGETDE